MVKKKLLIKKNQKKYTNNNKIKINNNNKNRNKLYNKKINNNKNKINIIIIKIKIKNKVDSKNLFHQINILLFLDLLQLLYIIMEDHEYKI